MRDAAFLFLLKEKQQCPIFLSKNRKKYTQKQYHRWGNQTFLVFILQKNSLKYLIYQINITDVFSMIRAKYHFVILFLWYLCEKKLFTNLEAKMQCTWATGNILVSFFGLIVNFNYSMQILF